MSLFRKGFSALLSLFFPRYCVVCERVLLEQERFVCLGCLMELPRTQFHLQPENAMEQLFWGKVEVRGLFITAKEVHLANFCIT